MRARSLCGVAVLAAVAGCGGQESLSGRALDDSASQSAVATAAAPAPIVSERANLEPAAKGAAETPPTIPRKIIYNARVNLVVESVGTVEQRLSKLIKEAGGYISQSDVSSSTQAQRTATWTVRIPVDRFEPFVADVIRLGELQQNHVDSQDVTQEYFDIEARIANKQLEEKRLLKHLSDSTGKLEEILIVEKELSRVRGEIEQMQGRIRYLSNLSSLSTVTITATEIHDYKPPVHPTFATEVARTFASSMDNLKGFLKAIVLFVVAVAPWVPVLVVLALPVIWIIWREHRSARRARPVLERRPPQE